VSKKRRGGIAILTLDQVNAFQADPSRIAQYRNDAGETIPNYAMARSRSSFGAGVEWKTFPKDVSVEDLLYVYRRMDIATNAVDIPPDDCWGKSFTVKVTDEAGKEVENSPFETELWAMRQKLRWSTRFKEAHIWDRCLGVGYVVIGIADSKKLEEPVEATNGPELKYLRVYSKRELDKYVFDEDKESETYGDIIGYNFKIGGKDAGPQIEVLVHADRVLLFMEKTISNDPHGFSVLEPPYDLFTILKNADWSAGEAYYQNASPLYTLSWDDSEEAEPPSKEDLDDAKEDLEDLHVKKRFIKPMSWEIGVVTGSGQLPDPRQIWNPIIERIAGSVKVPHTILLGTSAGALASGETNLQQYFKDIARTQENYCEPIVMDLIERLQKWGTLPEAIYAIEWPSLYEPTEKEIAETNKIKYDTARVAIGGEAILLSVEEARVQILNLNPEIGGGEQQTMKQDEPVGPIILLDGLSDTLDKELGVIRDIVSEGVISVGAGVIMFKRHLAQATNQVLSVSLEAVLANLPEDKRHLVKELPQEVKDEVAEAHDLILKDAEKQLEEASVSRILG